MHRIDAEPITCDAITIQLPCRSHTPSSRCLSQHRHLLPRNPLLGSKIFWPRERVFSQRFTEVLKQCNINISVTAVFVCEGLEPCRQTSWSRRIWCRCVCNSIIKGDKVSRSGQGWQMRAVQTLSSILRRLPFSMQWFQVLTMGLLYQNNTLHCGQNRTLQSLELGTMKGGKPWIFMINSNDRIKILIKNV